MAKILLVEDEANARQVLSLNLMAGGHIATGCANPLEAERLINQEHFDIVITDLNMDDNPRAGIDVVQMVAKKNSSTLSILLTAYASADTAVDAMREGAFDYLTKPVSGDELNAVVDRALTSLYHDHQASIESKSGTHESTPELTLVGESAVMQRVKDRLRRASSHDFTVLISGESGTGKELAARFVHAHSEHSQGPFVPVHCGAIPEGLFESELFGHCKGAFTSAEANRVGLIESAANGTLFLDEIGEMPMNIQVKLLRVLQEKSFRRVGEDKERPAQCRVVAATNRDLQESVRKGTFREDLFYRLNVVPVHIPPLRSRREDIPALVRALIAKVDAHVDVSEECLARLQQLPLLGNVRELENILQRLVALSDENGLDVRLLDEFYVETDTAQISLQEIKKQNITLDQMMENVEKQMVTEAMEEAGGNVTRAAKLLGISFRSMRYRLQKLGFRSDES